MLKNLIYNIIKALLVLNIIFSFAFAVDENVLKLQNPVYVNRANIEIYTHELPTSRFVSPIGLINATPNFPTGIALSKHHIFVISNGASKTHDISVYDRQTLNHIFTLKAYKNNVKATIGIPHQSFFDGIYYSNNSKKLYVAGGFSNNLLVLSFKDDRLVPIKSYKLHFYSFPKNQYPYYYQGKKKDLFYPDSVVVDKNDKYAYVSGLLSNAVAKINLSSGKITYANVGAFPFQVLLANSKNLIVSLWGDNKIAILNPSDLKLKKYIWVGYKTYPKNFRAGDHPTALCKINSNLVAVALTNVDKVAIVNIKSNKVNFINVSPFKGASFGSYPDGLACSKDKIFVANAGNNDVAVFSIKSKKQIGLIPTGWYPTSVYLDKNDLYIVSAKGLGSGPNVNHQWVGNMMNGLVQKVNLEDFYKNKDYYTYKSLQDNRFLKEDLENTAKIDKKVSTFLKKHIKYVVFILRENKTFDEDMGTYKRAGAWADPKLAFYTKRELPNLFHLADRFVLFANFMADGEVTAQAHQWTTGASDSDYIQRTWPMYYSNRGIPQNPGWLDYLGKRAEGYSGWGSVGYAPDDPFVIYYDLKSLNGVYSNPWISYPENLYLFNQMAKKHINFMDFGEFVSRNQEGDITPYLKKYIYYKYPGWDRMILDTFRVKIAIKELKQLEREDKFPRFIYIWLPDDHTAGLNPCYYTPQYYVANNDYATGKFIDFLSHTPYYKHMLIIITEDDAQSGADHIDAHRTIALAISPWVKRGYIDTNRYSQVDIVKTIELTFGLKPMSQWDQTATGFWDIWTSKPNFKPINARPIKVPMAILPGDCPTELRLRQKLGLKGEYLYRYKPSKSNLFTPTSLLKVSGQEQLKQIYIALKGEKAYEKLLDYIRYLAKENRAPISAFISDDD